MLFVDIDSVTSNTRNNFPFKAAADAEELAHVKEGGTVELLNNKDDGTVAKPNCSLSS